MVNCWSTVGSGDDKPLVDERSAAVPPDSAARPVPPEQHHPGKLSQV